MPPPAILPFRIPTRTSYRSNFAYVFCLSYIITILSACSKTVVVGIFEIKYEKNANPFETSIADDPAKPGLNRTRIELEMLDLCPASERARQLIAQIDGIDRDFRFGNARFPRSCALYVRYRMFISSTADAPIDRFPRSHNWGMTVETGGLGDIGTNADLFRKITIVLDK